MTLEINSSGISSDVTGTTITATGPIAVFAGAYNAWVPDTNTQSGNPLVQEQIPVENWGTNILSLSFGGRMNGDSYRILAESNNTVISITGLVITNVDETNGHPTGPWTVMTSFETNVVTNQAGQFYDIIVDGPVVFQASQPIQVVQFANGEYFDNPPNENGDPCEILLAPTDRYLETNIFFTLDNITEDFAANYLTIIVPVSAITNTFVDSLQVSATNFVAIGTSGYYGATIKETTSGTHTVTSSQPVGVLIYGFGQYDAYSYFGGIVK